MTRWILASASPRRRELLRQMGIREFEIIPATGMERSTASDPAAYVQELAEHKAKEVYVRECIEQNCAEQERASGEAPFFIAYDGDFPVCTRGTDQTCVIGADTVVVCGGTILGKPRDRKNAAQMIRRLQGNRHEVLTGVALIHGPVDESGHAAAVVDSFCCVTDVYVAPMDEEEIQRYLATGEADDKAGAYGIQGAFGTFIQGIEGDYYNVVGLPIAELYQAIKRNGLWS